MEPESLYERVLARVGEGGVGRLPAPRASAAVVPWRWRRGGGVEVWWMQRSDRLSFMGGWHAFPGGAQSSRDAGVPISGTPRGVEEAPSRGGFPAFLARGLDRLGPNLPRGVAACALRELFEETGILLARSPQADTVAPWEAGLPRLEPLRRRLLEHRAGLTEILAEEGLILDAAALVYAGRWLTPPLGPLRFDNRFFLLHWPEDRSPQPAVLPDEVEPEVQRAEWVEVGEALARWRSGEVMAAPPILHILTVLAEDGPGSGLPRLWDPAEAAVGPFRKVEFRPGVLLFPLATRTLPPASHTNAYLVGHGEAVLVDPGSGDSEEIEGLLAALEAAHRNLDRRVTAVWLTHHHPDHVGGVEPIREALGVRVLAHPETAHRLAERGLVVDGHLVDGQRVVLAGEPEMTLRVIHTPGHARGHLAFLDEEGGSVVTGDLLAGYGTVVIDPPEGDMDEYLDSLERLRDLVPPGAVLFPSHGPALRAGRDRLQEVIDHRRWREERVLAAWRAGCRRPEELVEEVYDELEEAAVPLAERQVRAHLDRLERAGRLSEAG